METDKVNIKFLVLDVDGTLTDGGMYFSESGDEFKRFNTKDGMVMKRLVRNGIPIGLISGGLGKNMVQRRAKMLGISYVYVGSRPKVEVLDEWKQELSLEDEQIAYIGDDINDVEIMEKVGFSACPSDAHYRIKDISDIILESRGGEGCIREFADKFLRDYI